MDDTFANTAAMRVVCGGVLLNDLTCLVAAFTRGGLSRHGVCRIPDGGTQDSTAMCEPSNERYDPFVVLSLLASSSLIQRSSRTEITWGKMQWS